MKILFLDQSGKLGGAELSLLDVTRIASPGSSVILFQDGPFRLKLEEIGVEVCVLCPNYSSEPRKDSSIWQGLRSLFQAFPLIREIADRSRNYDVIYANTQKAFIFGAIAGLLARRPVVYHLRDILSTEHFSAINIKVAVLLANYLSRIVIANSKATAQAFIQSGGKPDRVKVIYNGFDPQVYQPNPSAVATLRQTLQIQDKFVIGHFGRLSPWKGQHILLEALSHTPSKTVGLFVGAALFGEDEYARQLQEQVKALGLTDRVHFLGFRSDIPDLMGACDVIAHTSIAPEPFGRVIVETMCCGKPIIAAAAGGAAELIVHGKTGWSTTPGDVLKLASVINDCASDPATSAVIAHAGYLDAIERFHIDRTTLEINQLLVSLIQDKE